MASAVVREPIESGGPVPRASLRTLSARDYRNLANADLALPPEGMAVVGENGQGKTNLIEAIYYLQLLRSFRGARDAELVRFGESGFHVAAEFGDGGSGARQLAIGFDRAGKRKRVTTDGMECERLSDAIGAFPAVIFSPHDTTLVAGSPSARRRFLDVALALTSRAYLVALQRYRSALAQRNSALRSAATRGAPESQVNVAVWEPALATHGAHLLDARREWVSRNADAYSRLCASIGERGEAVMRYVSTIEEGGETTSALAVALERRRELDLRRGLTHAGPHRDDLELTLDGRELRTFGSAGQQRTAAIALRLLEASTLRERARREPAVLLDDPFAELDARRAARILELLEESAHGQTILVVPRSTDIPRELKRLERWRIAGGALFPSSQ